VQLDNRPILNRQKKIDSWVILPRAAWLLRVTDLFDYELISTRLNDNPYKRQRTPLFAIS